MAWKTHKDGRLEADGSPFENPADSFEKAYNAHIEKHGAAAEHHDIDASQGWPLSTRAAEPKPRSSEEVRRFLDAFFSPHMQDKALEAGNSDEELDKIAKDILNWAVYYHTPLLATERNVAGRLGVDVSACPEQHDDRIRHHSRLGI